MSLTRKWMKEIKDIFETNDPDNRGLPTSEVEQFMKAKGAGSGQVAGALNTALEIELLERPSYGLYKLLLVPNINNADISIVVNNTLFKAKQDINQAVSLESLDDDSFKLLKKVLSGLDDLKI